MNARLVFRRDRSTFQIVTFNKIEETVDLTQSKKKNENKFVVKIIH